MAFKCAPLTNSINWRGNFSNPLHGFPRIPQYIERCSNFCWRGNAKSSKSIDEPQLHVIALPLRSCSKISRISGVGARQRVRYVSRKAHHFPIQIFPRIFFRQFKWLLNITPVRRTKLVGEISVCFQWKKFDPDRTRTNFMTKAVFWIFQALLLAIGPVSLTSAGLYLHAPIP